MSVTGCCTYTKGLQLQTYVVPVCVQKQDHKLKSTFCSSSGGNRGFGPRPLKKEKRQTKKAKIRREGTSLESQKRESTSKASDTRPSQAPGISSQSDGKFSNIIMDRQFEERLQAIKRSALEQKKIEETNEYGTIDYDAPIVPEKNGVGFGTKVGVGIAVIVFGLVFALGDFLPSTSSDEVTTVVENKLTEEDKLVLKSRLEQYEKKLSISPEDPAAIEATAVTLSELGEYGRAASLLEKLTKEKPNDPDVYRLLGEVKYELKDYEGSATAYKSSSAVSETINFEVLRGLTNSLLAANKPDEAVQVLLASRERLNMGNMKKDGVQSAATSKSESNMQDIDPFQGIILKENGKKGEAERMFIQARFFAPEKAKALVDRYSRK